MSRAPGFPRRTALAIGFLFAAMPPFAARAQDEAGSRGPAVEAAFAAVAAGTAVVVMRHAIAPGTGDPADFRPGDCATQRNLSTEGRRQARAIGARLVDLLGTDRAEVYSSAWCRCLETGRLLGLGDVAPLPALDSFFRERDDAPARTAELREWIAARIATAPANDGPPAVLVTHQVNVTALTGVYPASGEMLVYGVANDGAVPGEPTVLARQTIE